MSTLKTNNIQHVDRSDPSIIINTDGSVNIAGTMTYEDVTSVDSVGIITGRELINAQKQVHVGTGVSIAAGGLDVTGISTFTGNIFLNQNDPKIFFNDGGSMISNANVANTLAFFSDGSTERLRIDSSGRLLLGTTTEGHTNGDDLTIATSGGTGITLRSGTSATGSIFFSDGTSGDAEYAGLVQYDHASNFMRFYANSSEKVRITSDPNLMINTTTAAITSGIGIMIAHADGARIKLCDSDLGVDSASGYEMIASNNGTAYLWNRENTPLLFGTNNNERMRILAAGAVVVAGTTAYSDGTFGEAKLQFNTKTGNHIGACSIADSTNSITHVLFKNPNGAIASFGTHNSDFIALTANVERLRITSGGKIHSLNAVQSGGNTTGGFQFDSVNTACVLGIQQPSSGADTNAAFQVWDGSSNNLRVNYSGLIKTSAGIDFSGAQTNAAGMTSETLDSYEEGTWTFAINPGGGSYQYNYGTTGYYRKVGNTVFINAWVHLIVSSAVSGGITISGLPFACQNRSRNWIPVGGYGHASGPTSAGLWMIITPNSTTASFYYNNTNYGAGTNLTAGNLGNSAELYINGSYFTDA